LGLAIVDAIASAHGGRVDVTTAPGGGATFTLILPAQPEPAAAPVPTTSSEVS
jgi:signal transduction histidine kinase